MTGRDSDARSTITIRRASLDDIDAIVGLAGETLGWSPDRPNAALFRWKHLYNPVGRSPMWLAIDEEADRPVGFRAFMRWRFRMPGGRPAQAVRAVDTATLPSHQGRGIFKRLTLHALDELAVQGVGFVFNTPNEQSRPGYLKMGWQEVGRLPIAAMPTSFVAAARMLAARVPAARWSEPTLVGDPAAEVLTDPRLHGLLSAVDSGGVSTERSPSYLGWRYGFEPLHYRAVVEDPLEKGVAVFRLRRRGAAVETAVCELLHTPGDAVTRRRLIRSLRKAGGDYLVGLGATRVGIPIPRQGPMLTWRPINRTEPISLGQWALGLGDVELF